MATNVPLLALIDAARRGDTELLEEAAHIFVEHATKLIEVRNNLDDVFNIQKDIAFFRLQMLFVQCQIQLKV